MSEPIPIAGGQWDSENCRGPWGADASCPESPYISNCDTSVYLENWHIDPRYLSSDRNRHGLPTGSMLVLLRKELETLSNETIAQNVRIFPGDFTTEWREHVLNNFSAPVVPVGHFKDAPSPHIQGYFNKHIAVYVEHGTSFTMEKHGLKPKVHYTQSMCRYIYRHWVRMYDERPPFQRRHFLAKPICFVEDEDKITPADRVTNIPLPRGSTKVWEIALPRGKMITSLTAAFGNLSSSEGTNSLTCSGPCSWLSTLIKITSP